LEPIWRRRVVISIRSELRQTWGEWLGELAEWDWFVTMTLRNPQGVPTWDKPGFATAKRAWGEFTKQAKPALGELTWVRMFEIQPWRGVPHIHALVADVDQSVRRMDLVDWAWDRWGIARVLGYEHQLGARFYLTKYVTKQIADIEFSRNLGRG
jgi:hypothetical protein